MKIPETNSQTPIGKDVSFVKPFLIPIPMKSEA